MSSIVGLLARHGRLVWASACVLAFAAVSRADAPALPQSLDELKALQEQVRAVVDRALPATVGVRVGTAIGSGVIVSADGYVLTAGHVSGEPGRSATIYLADGSQVRGQTLGANLGADSGLIKLVEDRTWPFVEMGRSAMVERGQWCVATGHPGGPRRGRAPVVRLGRILAVGKRFLRTDCTLISGDSGGPLFDLHGKVIGIHSHIGTPLTANMHVVVDTYRETWDRLVRGDTWGGSPGPGMPYLGVRLDGQARECLIRGVEADSPAARAGLQAGDVVLKFGDSTIADADDLIARTARRQPGDEVALVIRRDDAILTLKVVIGRRDS
jgi:serine protease Do